MSDLAEQLASLLDVLGPTAPQVGADDLESYFTFADAISSQAFAAAAVAGIFGVGAVNDGNTHDVLWSHLGYQLANGRNNIRKRGGQAFQGDGDKVRATDSTLRAALESGDMRHFRRVLITTLGRTYDADRLSVARSLVSALAYDHQGDHLRWRHALEQARAGRLVVDVPSEQEALALENGFVEGFGHRAAHNVDSDRRHALGVRLVDAWVARACAATCAEAIREQLEALTALEPRRVHVRTAREAIGPGAPGVVTA